MNPDTEVTEFAIEKLLFILQQNPTIGITALQLRYRNGSIQRSTRPFYTFWGSLLDNRFMNLVLASFPKLTQKLPVIRNHEVSGFTDWIKGAAFLMRGDLARELGGFDEQFWIYGEEMDLCKRVHNAGFHVYFLADAQIVHFEGQSTRQSSEKKFIQDCKTFYLYLAKNHSTNKLNWYHRRVKWFIRLHITSSYLRRSSEQSTAIQRLYVSLKQWVNSEGEQIVQQALSK